MNKSESKELSANKRVSARRASTESELPAADQTGTIARRVHARRATPESDLPVSQESSAEGEGIAFAADAGGSTSAEPDGADEARASTEPAQAAAAGSVPMARARARRPRAKQAASTTKTQPKPAAADELSSSAAPASPPTSQPLAAAQSESRMGGAPAVIVEAARWPASLQAPEEALPPPSLDHADFADDFGLDAQYESKLRPWLDSLCERHFHVELFGAENIPAHGRALLVANHSRANVWDGIVLRSALRLHHPAGRVPRWLVDDKQFHAPFLGTIVNRLGAVRACQENAERLLLREELVAVFPEGSKATDRPYEERYRLQRFGRGGYVKLALRTGTPVFPVAIVATEHEGAVWRNRLANASRVLSAPFAALRPGFPRIGMLGVPPISARIRIYVGASIAEISRQDASVTQDDGLVHELNECVRSAVQNLVNALLHA